MHSQTPRWRNLAQADQVQQRFGQVANQVQDAAARCSAVAPTHHGIVIARHRRAMLAAMHDLGGAIHDFMAAVPAEEVLRVIREEITKPIRAWSASGLFFHHAFTKPRGYPGDFETIEIIYDCCPLYAFSKSMPAFRSWPEEVHQ